MEAPKVGGVIPSGLQALQSFFQRGLLSVRRTLLNCEIGVKLKGPTKDTLLGPDRGRGSDHSMYLDASGV